MDVSCWGELMGYTVLLAVGGSGGHLLPAQQLAMLLGGEARVVFAGSGLSKSPFFEREEFAFEDVEAAPLWPPVRFLKKGGRGFLQSVRLLKKLKPDVVVGFGSYHAFPVLAAAALLRKNIILYEANSVLGKVNRLFAPLAHVMALQIPLQKPVRARQQYVSYFPWLEQGGLWEKERALAFYGFDLSAPVCLVFGGSQGAAFLNGTAPSVLKGCQVIHCVGKLEALEGVRLAYEKLGIKAFVQVFESEMARAYAAADFALCRSGAATTTELIRYRVPAVMVPFPYAAENHQQFNARFFCEEVKGGFWLEEKKAFCLREAVETCLLQLEGLKQALQKFDQIERKRVDLAQVVRSVGSCKDII